MNIQYDSATHPRTASLLRASLLFLAICSVAALIWQMPAYSGERAVLAPAPLADEVAIGSSAKAVFAGGCFWGVQGVFQHVKGVKKAVSGYAGGSRATAQYPAVSSGDTGHAEAVEITYDPKQISYGQLLQIFFSVVHDPTQLNRQGPDTGTQYRSAIFPANVDQKRVADSYIAQLDKTKLFPKPIVTKVDSSQTFYPAENYHQDYLTLNPKQPYIAINDLPKVENFKRLFPERYRDQPVLVLTGGTNAP